MTSDALGELEVAERHVAVEAARQAQAREWWTDIQPQAALLAKSRMVPAAYRGRPEEIMVAGLFGRTFNWDLVTSMRLINVIDGKPSFAAEGLGALVRKAGHRIEGGVQGQEATAIGTRTDGSTMTVTYSMRDAEMAGLLSKQNWRKHPKSMLWARAVSQLCRQLFPDVTLGSVAEDEIEPIESVRTAPAEIVAVSPVEERPLTLGIIQERVRRLDVADRETINARVAEAYQTLHPEITDIFAVRDGLLPQDQLERVWEFVQRFEPIPGEYEMKDFRHATPVQEAVLMGKEY